MPGRRKIGVITPAMISALLIWLVGCENELDRRVRETIEALSDDDGGRAIAAVRSWASGDPHSAKLVTVRQFGAGDRKWLKVEWIEEQFSIEGVRIYLRDGDPIDLPIHERELLRNLERDHDWVYFEVGLEKLPPNIEMKGGHAVLTRSANEVTDRVIVE